MIKDRIIELLSAALPAVDLGSDFLFGELDSLGVVTIMMIFCQEFDITLEATDVTPKNFRSIDALAAMVENKLKQKSQS